MIKTRITVTCDNGKGQGSYGHGFTDYDAVTNAREIYASNFGKSKPARYVISVWIVDLESEEPVRIKTVKGTSEGPVEIFRNWPAVALAARSALVGAQAGLAALGGE